MSDSDDNVQLRVESPKLLEGVIALLQAPTDNDKRRVFESRPDLLSDAAVDLLEQIEEMHRNRGDEQSARSTAGLGDIVKAAIAHGVDFGMLQQVVFEAVSKAPDDPSDVAAYFETVPDRFPELLQPLAIDVLNALEGAEGFGFFCPLIRKAIDHCRPVGPPGPAADPRTAVVLVSNLLDEYDRSAGLINIDRAIQYSKTAIMHGGTIPFFLDCLGIAHNLRFKLMHKVEDVDAAVECHHRVHEIGPVDDPQRPAYEDHYALALRAKYQASGDRALLDASIAISETLIERQWENAEDEAVARDNFASSLMLRFEATHDVADLESATEQFELARSLASSAESRGRVCMNLATALLQLGLIKANTNILGAARAAFKRATTETSGTAHPRFALGRNWTQIAFRAGEFADAADGYALAADAVRELVFVSERDDDSRSHWIRDFQWLVPDGAYALARVGKNEEAVLAIESGLNLLSARRRRASHVPSASLREDPGRPTAIIDEIRRRIPSGLTAVYALCTSAGGLLLLLTDGSVETKWLPSAGSDGLNKVLFGEHPDITSSMDGNIVNLRDADGYFAAQLRWRSDFEARISDPDVVADWSRALDSVLSWLWDYMLRDLRTILDERGVGRILLIPVGRLAGLPFHAAGSASEGDRTAMEWFTDSIDLAYATSILSLKESRTSVRKPGHAVAIADAGALQFAELEAQCVLAAVGSGALLHDATDEWSGLLQVLPSGQLWHFACHAHVDPFVNQPGYLIMPGGLSFRVDQIVGSTAPLLVVLSACATGALTRELLTENMSLASDFIEVGAHEVVASGWPVDDATTCLFMSYFCRMLPEAQWEAVTALRKTQRWMRTSAVDEKVAFIGTLPASPTRQLLAKRILSFTPGGNDWWAPFFVLVGRSG